ncbi:FMN-binding protein [Pseudonocardia sp. RS11V-5]|uniref:FMN-binding protein n=1 Tax=Pseudonocardia terrae TaxID=2905831 RepID=UPI001E563DC7|nr:FMN-binding protein [Pseudonocardia terrae]MCE3553266.1 FMN-binding protein [Pseudonocardia terrae]
MRRILTWFLSTVAVVALLFGYKTSTGASATPTSDTVVAAPGTGSGASAGSGSGSTGTSGSTGSSASSGTSGGTGTTTYTGSVAQTRWGPVQVAITVAGGKITNVTVPQYPNGNGRDQQINASALPVLTKETISAQSASIDMVSGATVTSDGYVQSLQSALDQAGLA